MFLLAAWGSLGVHADLALCVHFSGSLKRNNTFVTNISLKMLVPVNMNMKVKWQSIFSNLSEDGGRSLKWEKVAEALTAMNMRITLQELGFMNLKRDVMDFDSFFAIIRDGCERRRNIVMGAAVVESKREKDSYRVDYESTMEDVPIVEGDTMDTMVDKLLDDVKERFGDGRWDYVPAYSTHPDFKVDGAMVLVYRFKPDGMITTMF